MSKLSKLQEWETLPYDGLRGMPPDWVPEELIIRFIVNRDKIEREILNNKLSVSGVFSRLNFYIKKEKFWRQEDKFLELHHNEEALKITELIKNLKSPPPSNLDYVFSDLAKFHEDIKLGKDACLIRWLGVDIASNILAGKAQRKRSAAGGVEGGRVRREKAQHSAIINCARRLRQAGELRRGLASKIKYEGGFSLSKRQINYILEKAAIK